MFKFILKVIVGYVVISIAAIMLLSSPVAADPPGVTGWASPDQNYEVPLDFYLLEGPSGATAALEAFIEELNEPERGFETVYLSNILKVVQVGPRLFDYHVQANLPYYAGGKDWGLWNFPGTLSQSGYGASYQIQLQGTQEGYRVSEWKPN